MSRCSHGETIGDGERRNLATINTGTKNNKLLGTRVTSRRDQRRESTENTTDRRTETVSKRCSHTSLNLWIKISTFPKTF